MYRLGGGGGSGDADADIDDNERSARKVHTRVDGFIRELDGFKIEFPGLQIVSTWLK